MKHMLSIFATELKYQRDIFFMASMMLLVAGTAAAFFTQQWLWVMLGMGQVAYIIGAISVGFRMDSEKRERTASLLPFPTIAYGPIRFAIFATYHLFISIVIVLVSLTSLHGLPAADIFTLFGFNLVITAVIFINDDIFYIWGWGARIALWLLIIMLAVYSILTIGGFAFAISPEKPKSLAEVSLFNAAWILLLGLDIWIYSRRKSYLK